MTLHQLSALVLHPMWGKLHTKIQVSVVLDLTVPDYICFGFFS